MGGTAGLLPKGPDTCAIKKMINTQISRAVDKVEGRYSVRRSGSSSTVISRIRDNMLTGCAGQGVQGALRPLEGEAGRETRGVRRQRLRSSARGGELWVLQGR